MSRKSIVAWITGITVGSFVLNLAIANYYLSRKSSSSNNPSQSNQQRRGAIATTGQISPSVPKDTCGDPYDSSASAWYPVFLDGANVNIVRNTLCRDAKDATRKETGRQSVQVASFTNYERAWNYARQINASVGQPTIIAKESPVNISPISAPSPSFRSIEPPAGLNIR